MIKPQIINSLLIFLTVAGCRSYQASTYDYPDPVDTSDKPILLQSKQVYEIDGIHADNLYEGARLNDFLKVDEGYYRAVILPENFPINKSPWFSFRLRAESPTEIRLMLDYTHSPHRYIPKISHDRIHWSAVDTNLIRWEDSLDVSFPIQLDTQAIYVSAQELITSTDIYNWCDSLARHPQVNKGIYGKSVAERPLAYLDIWEGQKEDKDMIVLLSRQHPPEVTGYLAMVHFVETILDTNVISEAFRKKFRILVLPLLNPDGVDMGHWRHNVHGIDLNRDWGVYRQPEIRQTVDFIVRESKKNDNEVLLGIDFHSTQEDIFYTYADSMLSVIPRFKDYWLYGIDAALPEYELEEEASGITQPFSKVWFYTQFEAESITYEVGDETPRDFVKKKARVSAIEMMKLLLYYQDE